MENNTEITIENDKYNGWLVSNSILKRSLAVVGHYFLGYLIIGVPLLIIGIIIGVSVGLFTK